MRKISVICSFLMAFGLSALMVGCEPAKTATKQMPKASGPGSTTGGGTAVPTKPSKGTAETPKAAPKADDKKPEDAKEGDAAKAPDAAKEGEDAPKN